MRLVLRNDQDKYEIGENIRLAREAQGMSQDDLADLVGTSRKAVSRYETGTTEMGIVTFFQYAEALNSRPEAFFPERLFIQQDQTQTDELEAIIGTLSKEDRDILLTMAKRMQSGKIAESFFISAGNNLHIHASVTKHQTQQVPEDLEG